ncbi:hypothetical protein N431DRAFT_467730 [Stipitochalara longipes BDJ]|nr:hypothetical protein N431DRAFT_467730 [Stipitochalara longipes BDJ]
MVFENFFTEWYRNLDRFYDGPDPNAQPRGPKAYPIYPPRVPAYQLSVISKLKRTLPTPTEITEAITKLSTAMTYVSDAYGLIGGSAVLCYAKHFGFPMRSTPDINFIVKPDLDIRIYSEEVAKILCSAEFSDSFAVKRVAGIDIPQVKVMRGKIEVLVDVEIYDRYTWEESRADYDLTWAENERLQLVVGRTRPWETEEETIRRSVLLLNAPWMLRQKILAWNDREGLQRANDKVDIETLCDVMNRANKTLVLRSERDIRKLKAFLNEFDNDPMVLGSVIDCPEVFGPWYNLKWVRRSFAGFLFFAVPLAVDYYTSTTD